jgi:hypothetical protein
MMAQVKVGELLSLIPDEVLEKIGNDMKVDKVNQFLTGKTIFKVLLFSLAQTTRISLRYIENTYNSAIFQQYLNNGDKKIKGRHSSFADRLKKVTPDYFANIFNYLVDTCHAKLPSKEVNAIYRFDATIIGISSKLFKGIVCGSIEKEHIKVVIGQKGLIPSSVYFCKDPSEASDDKAIRQAIVESSVSSNDIITFDRGVCAGKTFVELSDSRKMFVSRVKKDRKYQLLENYEIPINSSITSDQKVLIFSAGVKPLTPEFRLIKVKTKDDELVLLTNMFHLSSIEIAQIYKRRWDIEVLFRFLKQELNLKHFLSRTQNGMMTYIYMILIFAVLLLFYKNSNALTGFKFVKMSFFQELENEIICDLIKISGGDPTIFLKKFNLL